jgi:carboxymethylenebutenolidase
MAVGVASVLQDEMLAIDVGGGRQMPAQYFRATTATQPVVLFVSGIFGLRPGVRDIIADLTVAGCSVLAPDLFFRSEPGPLADHGEEQQRAMARYKAFDSVQGMADLSAAAAALRGMTGHNGKLVVFGYCFGGLYAYLAAARGLVEGAVSFHGTKIGQHLDEAAKIACPIQFHVGDADGQIPMEEVERTRASLAGHPAARFFVYPGVGHGFTDRGRACHHEPSDAASFAAALTLLRSL